MPIYISTTCLRGGIELFGILDRYKKAGIKNIELGSSHSYTERHELIKHLSSLNSDFIVHNYFPPPCKDFIINLASQKTSTLIRSIKFIKSSIRFCSSIGAGLYSLHSGFVIDPNLNFNFENRLTLKGCHEFYQRAFETFLESVREVSEYAEKYRVKVAIENNGISKEDLTPDGALLVLMCRREEFKRLFSEIHSDNLGVLLDLGHLKTASHWLKTNENKLVREVKNRLFEIHVSENNGRSDEHRELNKRSACLKTLSKYKFKNIPITLESENLSMKAILYNKKLLQSAVEDMQ